MLTMTPLLRVIISRATRCRQKNTPLAFTRLMRSQSASASSMRSASIMITLLACRGPEDTVSSLILKSLLFGRPWWVNQRSPRQGDATVRDSDGPYVGGRKTQGAELGPARSRLDRQGLLLVRLP